MKSTDTATFITDLDGGAFERELGRVLSLVAAATVDHNKTGEVSIQLKMKRIGSSNQIQIEHTAGFVRPTSRGKQKETYTGTTAMYVTADGLHFYPTNGNQGMMLDKGGNPTDNDNKFPG